MTPHRKNKDVSNLPLLSLGNLFYYGNYYKAVWGSFNAIEIVSETDFRVFT